MDNSDNIYQWNGETVHLCQGCEYNGYPNLLSVYDTDCLLWYCSGNSRSQLSMQVVSMMWIQWLWQSVVRIWVWLSVVIPRGSNGSFLVDEVSLSEIPSLINHHYNTSFTVSHADTQVSILTYAFDYTIPRIQRLIFIIKLHGLFYSRARVTDDFRLNLIMTVHGNKEITRRDDIQL